MVSALFSFLLRYEAFQKLDKPFYSKKMQVTIRAKMITAKIARFPRRLLEKDAHTTKSTCGMALLFASAGSDDNRSVEAHFRVMRNDQRCPGSSFRNSILRSRLVNRVFSSSRHARYCRADNIECRRTIAPSRTTSNTCVQRITAYAAASSASTDLRSTLAPATCQFSRPSPQGGTEHTVWLGFGTNCFRNPHLVCHCFSTSRTISVRIASAMLASEMSTVPSRPSVAGIETKVRPSLEIQQASFCSLLRCTCHQTAHLKELWLNTVWASGSNTSFFFFFAQIDGRAEGGRNEVYVGSKQREPRCCSGRSTCGMSGKHGRQEHVYVLHMTLLPEFPLGLLICTSRKVRVVQHALFEDKEACGGKL